MLREGRSQNEIARALGVSKSTVAYHCRRLGRPADDRFNRRYDWADVQSYYDAGHSVRDCCEHFGCSKQTWHKAKQRGVIVTRPHAMPVEELLRPGTTRTRSHVKLRLLGAGLKMNRCELCGINEWHGRPLSLALHHVNGIKDDNRLENLSLLCPNCHSQTENFSGRNSRHSVRQERLATPVSQE